VVILYSSLSDARVGAGKLESVPERKMTFGGSVGVDIVRKFRALGIGMNGDEFRTALTSDAGIGSKIGVASNEASSGLVAGSVDMIRFVFSCVGWLESGQGRAGSVLRKLKVG